MPAKLATKTANVVATIYEGAFDIAFDCVGVTVCRFAMCSLMPPDGSEECTYRDFGSCILPHAKYAAMNSLRNRLLKELKQIEEDLER